MASDNTELVRYLTRRIESLDGKIDSLDEKVQKLVGFRWYLLGISAGVSFAIGLSFEVYKLYRGI